MEEYLSDPCASHFLKDKVARAVRIDRRILVDNEERAWREALEVRGLRTYAAFTIKKEAGKTDEEVAKEWAREIPKIDKTEELQMH
jgi:hypothetical protein